MMDHEKIQKCGENNTSTISNKKNPYALLKKVLKTQEVGKQILYFLIILFFFFEYWETTVVLFFFFFTFLTMRNLSLQCCTSSCSLPAKRLSPTGSSRFRAATTSDD